MYWVRSVATIPMFDTILMDDVYQAITEDMVDIYAQMIENIAPRSYAIKVQRSLPLPVSANDPAYRFAGTTVLFSERTTETDLLDRLHSQGLLHLKRCEFPFSYTTRDGFCRSTLPSSLDFRLVSDIQPRHLCIPLVDVRQLDEMDMQSEETVQWARTVCENALQSTTSALVIRARHMVRLCIFPPIMDDHLVEAALTGALWFVPFQYYIRTPTIDVPDQAPAVSRFGMSPRQRSRSPRCRRSA